MWHQVEDPTPLGGDNERADRHRFLHCILPSTQQAIRETEKQCLCKGLHPTIRDCSSATNKQTEHEDKAARPAPAALRQASASMWQHHVHRALTVKNHMHCNTRGRVLRESVFYNNLNVRAWDVMCHLGVYGNNSSDLGQFLWVNCGYIFKWTWMGKKITEGYIFFWSAPKWCGVGCAGDFISGRGGD